MQTPELDEAVEELTGATIRTGPSDELKAVTIAAMSAQASHMRLHRRRLRYLAVAAGVLLLLGAGFFFFTASNALTFAQVVQRDLEGVVALDAHKTRSGGRMNPRAVDVDPAGLARASSMDRTRT